MFKVVFYTEVVCQKIQHVPLVMSITFFPIKYCVACKKSTLKVLINLGFVTSFEDSHYILLFRYIYGAQLIQRFCYSKHLHVNRNYRPNGTATSLSPKCYSANVPLDFCTTADFEMKYFLTKALLAFWVIPNWFSRFCSQNGYLNSKLMLRWDGHFKYKFGIIHIKIARLRRASIIVSIFAAKRRFDSLFLDLEPTASKFGSGCAQSIPSPQTDRLDPSL